MHQLSQDVCTGVARVPAFVTSMQLHMSVPEPKDK